jgi:hypothetical protein
MLSPQNVALHAMENEMNLRYLRKTKERRRSSQARQTTVVIARVTARGGHHKNDYLGRSSLEGRPRALIIRETTRVLIVMNYSRIRYH